MPHLLQYTPEQQRFINKALQAIPDSPADRLNGPAKAVLQRNNFVFDAHSHVFDGRCIEADYVIIRILNMDDRPLVVRWLVSLLVSVILKNKPAAWQSFSADQLIQKIQETRAAGHPMFTRKDVDKLLTVLKGTEDNVLGSIPGLRKTVKRLCRVIDILLHDQMLPVYEYFDENAIHHQFDKPQRELISVQLGMDLGAAWGDEDSKKYWEQTDDLLTLSLTKPILPFLPVHPNREKEPSRPKSLQDFNLLYDTFIENFRTPGSSYFGIKCYPALGYMPAAAELAPIFHVCEQKNIPVLTHCGGAIISTFETSIQSNVFGKPHTIDRGSRKANATYLNEPANWVSVLSKFPNLRLCLGHFGGDEAWAESGKNPHHRIQIILQLMNACPNVYADFSFNIKDKKAREVFAQYLNSTDPAYAKVKERTLFGTDSWVVVPMTDLKEAQSKFMAITTGHHDRLFISNVTSYLGLH